MGNLNKEDVLKETKNIQKQNQEIEEKRAILNEDTLKSKIQSKKPKKEEISLDRRLGYRRKYLTEKYKKFKINHLCCCCFNFDLFNVYNYAV